MRNRKRYLAILLGGALLSGCAATPESSVVWQKGSKSQDNYREAEIFEQMIVIQNTDSYNDMASLNITDVTLGYMMRIYDPGADGRSGTLVPVWDFFGNEEVHSTYDGVEYTNYIDYPGNSFLTINAADGTIIDRSLGY